ncbi:MAG: ABC transporter substrate-binding protein [Nitrospirae bacterium]|nr:ABC transporter substrate-binding protein [Nitrospirota bacterium]
MITPNLISVAAILATLASGLRAESTQPACHRIVSLAPSVTEILFALGLGESVVGVTRFCAFPPEAARKDKVGGYVDTNYEAIAALDPDLVVLLPEQAEQERILMNLGIRTLGVDHRNAAGILNSIATIGTTCGKGVEAEALVADLRRRVDGIRDRVRKAPRPTVLISLGPNAGGGVLQDGIRTFARGGLFDELLTLAGGRNAYGGLSPEYPVLSAEGILQLNPQVIIELVPDLERMGWRKESLLERWKPLQAVDAVKNGRIYIFSQDYVNVPSTRFVLLLEALARAIHPELKWN